MQREATIQRRLGLAEEPRRRNPAETWPGAPEALEALDSRLKHAIRTGPPCIVPVVEDPFEALCLITVYQQISGKAAEAIAARARLHHPEVFRVPEGLLAVEAHDWVTVGVPRRRVDTMRRIAAMVQAGTLDLKGLRHLPDQAVRDALEAIPGIGPWSSGMFLLFHLKRPDVFLSGDLGVRKAMGALMGTVPDSQTAEAEAMKWRPWRSAAMWYLWHTIPDFPSPGVR